MNERYLTARVLDGEPDRYLATPEVDLFYREVLERLRAIPGVEAAEMTSRSIDIAFSGPALPSGEQATAQYSEASPGFFPGMGIPLLRGRYFTERDTENSPWVAIISETLARQYFPGEDPIGRFLQADLTRQAGRGGEVPPAAIDKSREIVGIVGDYNQGSPRREAMPPRIHVPNTQHPTEHITEHSVKMRLAKQLVLRTTLEPTSLASDLRRIVAEVGPEVAVFNIQTMDALLDGTVTAERFWMRALGIFSTLALVLAVVGIYGVVSYAVAQRTHEIGVRMALGAQRTDVLKMVIRQGMVMTVGGVIVGVLGAVAATRLLSSWLYEIEPTDPATFATVAVVLVGIALLATYVPARGAARVDPVNAMRSE